MNTPYFKIVLGYISGGFGQGFEKVKILYFKSKEKRDLFYEALGGNNKRGYGGLDMTGQRNFTHKNNWGYDSPLDHMCKVDPERLGPEKLYDDYDLSKLHIGKE